MCIANKLKFFKTTLKQPKPQTDPQTTNTQHFLTHYKHILCKIFFLSFLQKYFFSKSQTVKVA